MSIDLKVPAFPESVTDGTILNWHKKPGDSIRRDETVVDIETDKVVFEVPAPQHGVLEEIVEVSGSVVESGQIIGRMGDAENAVDTPVQAGKSEKEKGQTPPFAMPSARRLIEEHGLDAAAVPASGSGNRILKEDVLGYIRERRGSGADSPTRTESQTEAAVNEPVPAPTVVPFSAQQQGRNEKRVPMTRLRARIAERLLEAQQTAAILTTFNEINMQPVMDLRRRHGERFRNKYGMKLGFMSFFVKAVVEGLRRFPEINASIDGTDIVYHGYFDIGIAVSSPRGLVVPILRDADRANMADIEAGIIEYADKARDGKLDMEDITGGTFSITNGGIFGSLLSTPILNPPQSGILGMHSIQERPVAENGQVVIRPMMYVALSYDHRLVDGKEAVQFLLTVKEALEDPARMLLGV